MPETLTKNPSPNFATISMHMLDYDTAVVMGRQIAIEQINNVNYNTDQEDRIRTLPKSVQAADNTFRNIDSIVESSIFHTENGEGSTEKNNIDHDSVGMFNQAIKNLIAENTDTALSTKNLVQQLILFARQNSTCVGWNDDELKKEIESIIRGQLSEKKLDNLLEAAHIRHFDSTVEQDVHKKIDGFIRGRDGNYFYAYDNKNTFGGLVGSAQKARVQNYIIYEFSEDGDTKEIMPGDKHKWGTLESPVVHVLPLSGRYLISVNTGRSDLPEKMVAENFNPSGSSAAVKAITVARQFMDKQAKINPEITLYRLENDRFLAGHIAKHAGRTAVSKVIRHHSSNFDYKHHRNF